MLLSTNSTYSRTLASVITIRIFIEICNHDNWRVVAIISEKIKLVEKICFILEMQKQQHRNKTAADDSAEQAERNKTKNGFIDRPSILSVFFYHTGKVFSEEH